MSLQDKIHEVMDKLSNGEGDDLTIDDAWIEESGEAFKDALRRQFTKRDDTFRMRMSNVGKPLCQLQMGKAGAAKSRKDYNFIGRMLLGDATECITDVILQIAGANITGGKSKVTLELGDHKINGENDVEIDNKVYDIKSSAPFAFDTKWRKGYEALRAKDDFGYVAQLNGYAEAGKIGTGGWIVTNKSTGEILVIEAEDTAEERATVLADIKMKADALEQNWAFRRCFEPQDDFFNKKFTDSKKLPMSCVFCDFRGACWPKAKLMNKSGSKAKEPPKHWYTRFEGVDL